MLIYNKHTQKERLLQGGIILRNNKAFILMLTILIIPCLCACSLFGSKKIPDYTSKDLGLYIADGVNSSYVVDSNGIEQKDYSIDRKGNIIDANKNVMVGASKTEKFIKIEEINILNKTDLDVSIKLNIVRDQVETENGGDGMASYRTVETKEPEQRTIEYTVKTAPDNAQCEQISVSCDDSRLVLSTADMKTGDGTSEIVLNKENGIYSFSATVSEEGTYALVLKSNDGAESKQYLNAKYLTVTQDNVTQTMAQDQQTPTAAIVQENTPVTATVVAQQPTTEFASSQSTAGWIRGSKVNLREKATTSSNVLASYTSGKAVTILGSKDGWTKIQVDGQTGYVKTVYVTETNPNAAPATNNTNGTYYTNGSQSYPSNQGNSGTVNYAVPPAANDGGNHGNATSLIAQPSEQTEHPHIFEIAEIVEPTETTPGYTIYRCACGATYYGDTTTYKSSDTHTHAFNDDDAVIVPPTCTEPGYTVGVCSCGESYKHNFINPTGHSFTTYTDPSTGNVIRHCTLCGIEYPLR